MVVTPVVPAGGVTIVPLIVKRVRGGDLNSVVDEVVVIDYIRKSRHRDANGVFFKGVFQNLAIGGKNRNSRAIFVDRRTMRESVAENGSVIRTGKIQTIRTIITQGIGNYSIIFRFPRIYPLIPIV